MQLAILDDSLILQCSHATSSQHGQSTATTELQHTVATHTHTHTYVRTSEVVAGWVARAAQLTEHAVAGELAGPPVGARAVVRARGRDPCAVDHRVVPGLAGGVVGPERVGVAARLVDDACPVQLFNTYHGNVVHK